MQNRESLISVIAERLGTDTDCTREAGVLFDRLRKAGLITFDERDGYVLADGVNLIAEFEKAEG